MSLITWSPALEVGVSQIDREHKKLVELLNKLSDAMKEGHGKDVLGTLLHDLVQYTIQHFTMEENLMKVHRYPSEPDHKHEHDDLKKTVSDLQEKLKSGKMTVSIETMTFLKTWLNNHILMSDKKLALHLNGVGVR
jgi:hemerythrin